MFLNRSRTIASKDQANTTMVASQSQQQFLNSQVTLARLISLKDWSLVENLLCSRPIELIQIDDRKTIDENNILHFACRFNAPLSTVKLLASKYPKSVVTPDAIGRFAIHVASKYGASPLVIHFLICENFAASGVPDDAGKAPIHYVAQYYQRNYSGSSKKELNEDLLQVVRLFKASAPESFNLEDNEECNAIEYALESNMDIKVVKAMQRAARDDWRDLKKKHGLPHEQIARDLEKTASENRKILLGSIDEDVEMEVTDKPSISTGMHCSDSSVPLASSRSYVAKTA